MTTRTTRTLPITLALLMLQGTGARAQQTIKLGTLAPDGSPWQQVIRDMADQWKEATGGKVTFRIYAGGVAGDEPDMVRKMRIGQLQAASLTGNGLADIAPEIQAVQLPMVLANYEELDYVMEKLGPRFEKLLEEKGFKVLNWGDAGWVHYFSQKPVVSPDDLKPQKLFVWAGDTLYVEAYKDMGYHPVPMALTDMHMGLSSGFVNAFAATPLAALSFQWFGQAKHMVNVNWLPLVGATVIDLKAWNKIPDDVKPALLEAAKTAGGRMRAETRKLGDEAVATMKKHGLEVHAVTPEALAAWEKIGEAARGKIVGKAVPAEMADEVRKVRDELRAKKGAAPAAPAAAPR